MKHINRITKNASNSDAESRFNNTWDIFCVDIHEYARDHMKRHNLELTNKHLICNRSLYGSLNVIGRSRSSIPDMCCPLWNWHKGNDWEPDQNPLPGVILSAIRILRQILDEKVILAPICDDDIRVAYWAINEISLYFLRIATNGKRYCSFVRREAEDIRRLVDYHLHNMVYYFNGNCDEFGAYLDTEFARQVIIACIEQVAVDIDLIHVLKDRLLPDVSYWDGFHAYRWHLCWEEVKDA